MKRHLCLVSLCLVLAATAHAEGTVEYHQFYSPSLGENRAASVYLPDGYDPAGTTRYPVIYFLHGWFGNHTSYWSLLKPALDDLIGTGQIAPCIMVEPNGWVAPYDGSLWINSELYGAIAAHSGFFSWDRLREDLRDGVLAEQSGDPPYNYEYGIETYTSVLFMFAGGYTPNLENPPSLVDYPLDPMGEVDEEVLSQWITHNPDVLAAALDPADYPAIYFDCGDQDHFFMYPTNFDLAAAFDALGVPYTFRPYQGGHDLVAASLPHSLGFLDEAMAGTAEVAGPGRAMEPGLRLMAAERDRAFGGGPVRGAGGWIDDGAGDGCAGAAGGDAATRSAGCGGARRPVVAAGGTGRGVLPRGGYRGSAGREAGGRALRGRGQSSPSDRSTSAWDR